MTFRHMKILILVADLGSMTEAAKRLYISQPSVSQAIREIEDNYEIKLFERFSKKLYITDAGKHYLDYARHIVQLYDEMTLSLSKKSTLKMGASLTVGEALMPSLMTQFKALMPNIETGIYIKNTFELELLILNNQIDLALVEGKMNDPHIATLPVMEDELVLICGQTHPLYDAKLLGLDQLEKFNFIVREQGSGTRELLERVFKDKGLNLKITWECSGFDSIKKSVVEGHGLAAISRRLITSELESKAVRIIESDQIKFNRTFSIAHHRNKYMTPVMLKMIELIKQRN